MLNRKISPATGVSATTPPARRPAAAPNQRRTARKTIATVATPSRACGASTVQALNPKRRAAISMTQSDPGALSTVMKFEASRDPKKKAAQLFVPASTAAE